MSKFKDQLNSALQNFESTRVVTNEYKEIQAKVLAAASRGEPWFIMSCRDIKGDVDNLIKLFKRDGIMVKLVDSDWDDGSDDSHIEIHWNQE